jgi:WD40 repeat protein
MQLLSGKETGLRRWRVADGQRVGNQMGREVDVISMSRDGRWIVYGGREGASVWDAETQEKALEVEGTVYVGAVDISPESTRFATATGTSDRKASIWNIITGERLVGPLQHDDYVAGIKFSPNSEHIATVARDNTIRVFDSHNGDQLIAIKIDIISSWAPMTPLAWSNNGQQVFTASSNRKIKSFNVSTGSQLAESQVPGDDVVASIALATNGKFLATFAGRSISFWDTSTLTQIGPVIEDIQGIRSIALSPDCSHLSTGGKEGNITIRNLNNVLPDLYGPFQVSIYVCTISSDKSHILSLLSSPLDTYSRRTWFGNTSR